MSRRFKMTGLSTTRRAPSRKRGKRRNRAEEGREQLRSGNVSVRRIEPIAQPEPPDLHLLADRLAALDLACYEDYLRSAPWHELRRGLLLGRRCACGARATQLHHLTYERLGEEIPADLEALCDRCHRSRHGIPLRKRIRKTKKGPARGPSTIPPDTGFEASLRRFEQM